MVGGLESKLSDPLWLSFSLALAKPNNMQFFCKHKEGPQMCSEVSSIVTTMISPKYFFPLQNCSIMYNLLQEDEDSLESSMDSLENDKMTMDGIHQDFKGWTRTSVLGESITEGVDQDSLSSTEDECSHNINRKS